MQRASRVPITEQCVIRHYDVFEDRRDPLGGGSHVIAGESDRDWGNRWSWVDRQRGVATIATFVHVDVRQRQSERKEDHARE
jgi:hypothetical protein